MKKWFWPVLFLLTTAVSGEETELKVQQLKDMVDDGMAATPVLKMDCNGGLQYDDGSFENGYGSSSVFGAHYVMRIDPDVLPMKIANVCTCWARAGSDSSVDYDLVIWDSDGPGGGPGSLLATAGSFTAVSVPFGLGGSFYQVDLSSLGLIVNRPFYVGPSWDSGDDEDFFVCSDENGFSSQPGYVDSGIFAGLLAPDTALGTASIFPNYRNLGIRVTAGEITSEDCIEDLENGMVCLREDRFEITGTWTDFNNPPNTQPLIWTSVEDINATAGFQNNPTGVQIVMRAADACSLTGTYWLWLGGFTDAGWNITVRDTVTGNSRSWTRDPSSGNFPATTRDTTTFTCN